MLVHRHLVPSVLDRHIILLSQYIPALAKDIITRPLALGGQKGDSN